MSKRDLRLTRAELDVTGTRIAPDPVNPAPSAKKPGQRHRDSVLFQIAPGWGIGYDDLQWMLMRQQGKSNPLFRSVSFHRFKSSLERVIWEKGIEVTAEGRAALDALPAKFSEWIEGRKAA
jgi:hypothetical protein